MRALAPTAFAVLAVGCRDAPVDRPLQPPASPKSASQLAIRLRGENHFLVGLGSGPGLDEADHPIADALALGPTLDLNYTYLRGLPGRGGWSDTAPPGAVVDRVTGESDAHGSVPMFTLYAMAAEEEDNLSVLTSDSYMSAYWTGARLLFQRLGAFARPSVVHLEPDFWGFCQKGHLDATSPVMVRRFAPECTDAGDDLRGMVVCLVDLARAYAPRAVVGAHASRWAGTAAATVRFLRSLEIERTDFVVADMLDRDAGCWERATDPACQGPRLTGFYLDETNRTSPNFREVLAWSREIHEGLGLPVLWWQLPLGVPSEKAGGQPGHYRDNRVRYLFHHVDEFVAAGAVGAAFGAKTEHQTTVRTDGGQFRAAVTAYYAHPVALP